MNSLTYRSRLKKDLWSKFRLGPKVRTQDRHNPESASKITADPRSAVFSKSANPLDLQLKSTIRALFKAKSVDPKTYSPPSGNKMAERFASVSEDELCEKCLIKQLLNSVFAWYHNLSKPRVCVIHLLSFDNSWYHAQPHPVVKKDLYRKKHRNAYI